LVVLGVGLGVIPDVCRELIARDPRWRVMVERVKTVATQAFQIWMRPEMAELGWPKPGMSLSGFVEPFDTWADMGHLIPREGWQRPPGALAYFCNVLADGENSAAPDYPARQRERVRRNAVRFLNEDVARLWPAAARAPGEFRWDALVDPDGTGASDGE